MNEVDDDGPSTVGPDGLSTSEVVVLGEVVVP